MSNKRILKFGAEWCNACVQADRYLNRTKNMRKMPVEVIDVEASEELTVKYNIRNLPTFVMVTPNGDEIKRMVGFSIKDFEAFEDIY